jgi:hypothetical protein
VLPNISPPKRTRIAADNTPNIVKHPPAYVGVCKLMIDDDDDDDINTYLAYRLVPSDSFLLLCVVVGIFNVVPPL